MFEQLLDEATEFGADLMEHGVEVGAISIVPTAVLVGLTILTGSTLIGVVAITLGYLGLMATVAGAILTMVE